MFDTVLLNPMQCNNTKGLFIQLSLSTPNDLQRTISLMNNESKYNFLFICVLLNWIPFNNNLINKKIDIYFTCSMSL